MNLAILGGQQSALPPKRIFATSGAFTAPALRNGLVIAGHPARAGFDAGTPRLPPGQCDDRRYRRQAFQASPGRLLRQACQHLLAATLALLALAAGAQEAPPVGDLKTLGDYPLWRQSHSVTPLAGGRYFLHGAQPIRYNPGKPQDNPVLRERRRASTSLANGVAQVARDSWLWLPERKGWKRLGDMPECPINAYLQAVTPLAGGDVLLTGGLCDAPKMGDDPSEHPLYLRSSRLNGKTLQWEASPDLHEGRLFHTATAFPDGSVLVVGGQRDPALNPAAYPVLASVERLHEGRFVSVAPMNQARAGHSATLLDAGHLLVCGGFDALGEALASVELWDAASQRWLALPPLRTARHGHSATRLADGRVLVAGGFDVAGQPLRSSEIWDPARGEWLPGGVLTAPVGRHRAALLSNGDVLLVGEIPGVDSARHNFGHLWRTLGNTWLPAAPFESDGAPEPRFVPSIAPLPDGSAVVFGRDAIWRWQAHNAPAAPPAPRWQGPATLVRTGNVQVMLLAADEQTPAWHAYLWDGRSAAWRAAGRLAHARMGRTAAVHLPSGRVLHLAEEDANRLHCELSPSGFADQDWEDCAGFTPEYVVESPAGLGLLADGRAVALVNMSEAFIFDEAARRWSAGKLEWHTTGLAFGTPVRGETPLARVRDAAGNWHDISALGARFWGQAGARVDHDVVSNGQVIRSVSGRGEAPAMLWNPQRGYWDYIFPDHKLIGRNPEILPDGCAVSIQPPSLFDPKSGLARRLTGQLSDIADFDNSMVALADGTLVIASAAHGGTASRIIFSRASCAGLAERDGDRFLMPAEFAADLPAPVAPPKAPAAPELPAGQRWRAYLAALPAGVWIAPALLVVLAILRWWLLPALQRRHASDSTHPATSRGRTARLHQPVPVAWRRGLRIVFYGAALFLIVPPLFRYLTLRLGEQAQACAESSQACLDPQSGLLRSVPSLARQGSGATAQAHIPCRHVGNWSSRNGNQIRRITLRDDGTYQMAPMVVGADRRAQYTGHWMVQSGHMVWRDKHAVQELDINRIESESEGVFTLIEGNGSRTRFERIAATPSSRCLP